MPPELAERTLALCHPRDVAAFAQTCRRAHALHTRTIAATGVDWRAKLQRRVRAERIARRDGDRREFVDVVLECIREAAAPRLGASSSTDGSTSSTSTSAREPSNNLSWVTRVLALGESPWIKAFLRLEQPESVSPRSLSSASEMLRAHLALSLDHGAGTDAPEKLRALRRVSRAHVYDLRNYAREVHWGPFTPAGDCVNWTHVNAIVTVVTMNLRDFGVHWPKEFRPQSMRSSLDWAGVEGQWMRIVCFCDYRRAHIPFCEQNSGWNPGFFDDEFQEASRLLLLDLRLISVESDPGALEKLPDPSRPPITFGGTMRGFNSDEVLNRSVRGTVRVMRDGNIRWSFVSIYNRHDQWRLVSIEPL
ncbi:hypothetical protein BC826DRAFT_1004124 [Russula brevipes]|nr:hypothetical protein BC826DRAFT_1004124 [Russula brevipes]